MSVEPAEILYRGVYESGQKKLAKRGMVPQEVFDNGTRKISVDRADDAPEDILLELGVARARHRQPLGKRRFHGWVKLTAAESECEWRRWVEASKRKATRDVPANPHHADIVLADALREEERLSECSALASLSAWAEASPNKPIKPESFGD